MERRASSAKAQLFGCSKKENGYQQIDCFELDPTNHTTLNNTSEMKNAQEHACLLCARLLRLATYVLF